MHLFIFPNAVSKSHSQEQMKLNINGKKLVLILDKKQVVIDTELLRNGSSTMVMYNPVTDNLYSLYNFREILQVLDMTPLEMLRTFNNRGLMQIDKSGNDLFIKVFLLKGETELQSDTTDFSGYKHCTKDYIHPLDWQYSWTLKNVKGNIVDNCINISFELVRSDFWKDDIYFNHAGQSFKLQDGLNTINFRYVPGEMAYIGTQNCRYKGRMIDLERLVYDWSK